MSRLHNASVLRVIVWGVDRSFLSQIGRALFAFVLLVAAPRVTEGALTVAWDRNPEPDVVAYRIHVGRSPGVYTMTFEVRTPSTSFVFTGGAAGVRFYFAVSALGSGGNESPRSAEVSALWVVPPSGNPVPPPSGNPVPPPSGNPSWVGAAGDATSTKPARVLWVATLPP